MASNMNTIQVQASERRNAEGLQKTMVETVDYRSYPGQDPQQGQLRKENVEVIHQFNPHEGDSATGAGILGSAAAVVANTIQSAKDAISGTGTSSTTLPISQGQTKK